MCVCVFLSNAKLTTQPTTSSEEINWYYIPIIHPSPSTTSSPFPPPPPQKGFSQVKCKLFLLQKLQQNPCFARLRAHTKKHNNTNPKKRGVLSNFPPRQLSKPTTPQHTNTDSYTSPTQKKSKIKNSKKKKNQIISSILLTIGVSPNVGGLLGSSFCIGLPKGKNGSRGNIVSLGEKSPSASSAGVGA